MPGSRGAPLDKAPQVPANSAFRLRFGVILEITLGGRATFGGALGRSWAPDPLGGVR